MNTPLRKRYAFRAGNFFAKDSIVLTMCYASFGANGHAGKRAFKRDDHNRLKVNLIMVKPLQFSRLTRHKRDKANRDEFFASEFPAWSLG
jgi:hypothetical protein